MTRKSKKNRFYKDGAVFNSHRNDEKKSSEKKKKD